MITTHRTAYFSPAHPNIGSSIPTYFGARSVLDLLLGTSGSNKGFNGKGSSPRKSRRGKTGSPEQIRARKIRQISHQHDAEVICQSILKAAYKYRIDQGYTQFIGNALKQTRADDELVELFLDPEQVEIFKFFARKYNLKNQLPVHDLGDGHQYLDSSELSRTYGRHSTW